jgi:Bacterial regulatory proteins, lacI family
MALEKSSAVNLRTVAQRVGLAPCSVSAILNNTPASQVIPQATKDRVIRAAAELNYRPNLWARSLRTKRTRMVAAVAPDFGRGGVARVLAAVQRRLHSKGYLLALETADFSGSENTSASLQQRGIEGLIAIDTVVPGQFQLPVASVELDFLASIEPLTEQTRAWLVGLGESAAETIVRQIEQQGASRKISVEAKLPVVSFDLPSALAGVEVRERA